MNSYNVVFCYTVITGGFHGVRTWSQYKNKEAFQKAYTDETATQQEIVREGVSKKEAIELVKDTPRACYVAAYTEEATDDEGIFHENIFKMKMSTMLVAEQLD